MGNIATSLLANFLLGIMGHLQVINALYNYITMSSEFRLETTPEEHGKGVSNVQRQVKEWNGRGVRNREQKMTIERPTKSVSTSEPDESKDFFNVSLDLNQIIKLDPDKKTVTLEPGVMVGQISRYLFKRDWTIPVVPEIETLSIGELTCGAGLGTSSNKFGLFHETCLEYEVVLPSGEVVTCSKENDPDLFYAIPGSCGTIGFLTAVTIPLIPAKSYVKHQYRLVSSIAEFQFVMKTEPHHDFVEGLAYSKDRIMLMFGDLDDGLGDHKVHHINRWYKLPFYKLVESIMNKELASSSVFTEYIPLIDYYHRHSRAYFWKLPRLLPILNSRIFLFLFGWNLPINFDIRWMLPSSVLKNFTDGQVNQDYVIPMDRVQEFLKAGHDLLKMYPVWLCPVLIPKTPGMLRRVGNGDYVNLGYYSYPRAEGFHPVKTLETLVQLCIKVKGFQALHADSFMNRDEFHEMYDTSRYDRLRRERGFDAAFQDVYDEHKARNLDKLLENLSQ